MEFQRLTGAEREFIHLVLQNASDGKMEHLTDIKLIHSYPKLDLVLLYALILEGDVEPRSFHKLKEDMQTACPTITNAHVLKQYTEMNFNYEQVCRLLVLLFQKTIPLVKYVTANGLTINLVNHALRALVEEVDLLYYVRRDVPTSTYKVGLSVAMHLKDLYGRGVLDEEDLSF